MGLRELDYLQCYLDLGNRIAKKVDTKHSEIWLSNLVQANLNALQPSIPLSSEATSIQINDMSAPSQIFFFSVRFLYLHNSGRSNTSSSQADPGVAHVEL